MKSNLYYSVTLNHKLSFLKLARLVARSILPEALRRPLANWTYRIIAVSRNLQLRLSAKVENERRITLLSLPKALFGLIKSTLINYTTQKKNSTWQYAASYRYLLAMDTSELSMRLRLQRLLLRMYLSLPDIKYKYVFSDLQRFVLQKTDHKNSNANQGIVFMIGGLGPGGSERQVVLTMSGLTRRYYCSPRLFCLHLKSDTDRFYLSQLESAGLSAEELNHDSNTDQNTGLNEYFSIVNELPSSLQDVSSYLRTLHAERPALLHLWLDEINIKAGIAAVILGIPRIVLSLRSLPPCNFPLHRTYMREAYRWLASQSGVIFVNNSHAGARAYEQWIGLTKNTINVIHNGFDFDNNCLRGYQQYRADIRKTCNIPENAQVVGSVMRLTEEKRPFLWLDVAAKLRQKLPDVHFLIVGDGPLMQTMIAHVEHLGLDRCIHFAGHIKEVFSYISAMDIFLLTSRAEGLPNVLVEAQAMAVPVVTTRAGGSTETLEHGITGWVLDDDDPLCIADILADLLKDNAWLVNAREQAPNFVKNAFGIERMINETVAIYEMEMEEKL